MQTGEAPPTFRLEVNDRSLMTRDYGFWLENRLRQRFDLDGVPLIIEVKTGLIATAAAPALMPGACAAEGWGGRGRPS